MNNSKIKICLFLLFAIIAVALLPCKAFSADAWYDGAYRFRKKLTIDHTMVSGSSDLTNFPVLVSYTDTDLRTTANGGWVENINGFDIIFTDADATNPTKLDHEIEIYNSLTGVIVMWVKIPTLSYNTDTDIYIYYGNSSISATQENVSGTWDEGNFVGVWHMAEKPGITTDGDCGGGTKEVCDSTSNSNDADANGSMTRDDLISAVAGNGLDFDGTDDYLEMADSASFDSATGAGQARTWSMWLYITTAVDNKVITEKSDFNGDHFWLQTQGTSGDVIGGVSAAGSYLDSNPAPGTGSWKFVAITYDGTNGNLYVDGSLNDGPVAMTAPADNNHAFWLACDDAGNCSTIKVDELRVSNTDRSADWLATEYNNQVSTNQGTGAGKFIKTLGSEERKTLYRSVGNTTADLNTGSVQVEIVGSTATFESPMPDKIGVGDVLVYPKAAPTDVAIINGRTSSTVYSVQSQNGGIPTAAAANTEVNVCRAYTSIVYWEANTTTNVNSCVDETVDEDVPYPSLDLSTDTGDNFIAMAPCYKDADDTVSSLFTLDGWKTRAETYIKIYTPTETTEVGTSQRHTGVGGTGYVFAPTIDLNGGSDYTFRIFNGDQDQVRIEGLEISGENMTDGQTIYGVEVSSGAGESTSDIRVEKNLIRDITNSTNYDGGVGYLFGIDVSGGNKVLIANNIIYSLTNVSGNASSNIVVMRLGQALASVYIYNNTIFDIKQTGSAAAAYGVNILGGTTVVAKNNYVGDVISDSGSEADYNGDFAAGSTNNVSSDATADDDADMANAVINKDLYARYFTNIQSGSENLHINGDSNCLWGSYGADLRADAAYPITDDIDGDTRGDATPDIGADEETDISYCPPLRGSIIIVN